MLFSFRPPSFHRTLPPCGVFVQGASIILPQPMKASLLPSLLFSVILSQGAPVFAQTAEPAAPAGATPATAPAAAKPKPLGSGEKSFVKNALEDTFSLLSLSDKKNIEQLKAEDAKAVGTRLSTELTDLWAELGPVATANGDKLPETVSASDKSKSEHLKKLAPEKFDKEWIKLITKETKHLAVAFAAISKSTDPQIKAIAAKWAPITKAQNDDAEKAEKVIAKAK